MQAVAINDISAEVFENARKNGAVAITGTGCVIIPWETYAEITEDAELGRLIEEREARQGKRFMLEEVEKELGITQEDIEAAGEVEFV